MLPGINLTQFGIYGMSMITLDTGVNSFTKEPFLSLLFTHPWMKIDPLSNKTFTCKSINVVEPEI